MDVARADRSSSSCKRLFLARERECRSVSDGKRAVDIGKARRVFYGEHQCRDSSAVAARLESVSFSGNTFVDLLSKRPADVMPMRRSAAGEMRAFEMSGKCSSLAAHFASIRVE